jgi:hypothetical protein
MVQLTCTILVTVHHIYISHKHSDVIFSIDTHICSASFMGTRFFLFNRDNLNAQITSIIIIIIIVIINSSRLFNNVTTLFQLFVSSEGHQVKVNEVCCLTTLSTSVIMQRPCWKVTGRGELKYSERILCRCHTVYVKISHMEWPGIVPGRPRRETGD